MMRAGGERGGEGDDVAVLQQLAERDVAGPGRRPGVAGQDPAAESPQPAQDRPGQ